jgi:uncharacterized protein YndB with AHSA1/START domain
MDTDRRRRSIELPCEADIRCSAETIFDLIVDFRGQERWLGKSSSFRGTHDISSDPVVLGTTYREPGPLGVRNGTVTEYERPTRVAFHQPMTGRFRTGTIDVLMRYTLAPRGEWTLVRRLVTIDLPGRSGCSGPCSCARSRTRAAAPCARSRPTPTR